MATHAVMCWAMMGTALGVAGIQAGGGEKKGKKKLSKPWVLGEAVQQEI